MKNKELLELAHAHKQAMVIHWNRFFPFAFFSLDGTAEHVSDCFLRLFGIADSSLFLGKYNILLDKENLRKKSMYAKIQKAFNGEKVTISNFSSPLKTFLDMGMLKEKPPQLPPMTASLSPYYEHKKLNAIFFFIDTKGSKNEKQRTNNR